MWGATSITWGEERWAWLQRPTGPAITAQCRLSEAAVELSADEDAEMLEQLVALAFCGRP